MKDVGDLLLLRQCSESPCFILCVYRTDFSVCRPHQLSLLKLKHCEYGTTSFKHLFCLNYGGLNCWQDSVTLFLSWKWISLPLLDRNVKA